MTTFSDLLRADRERAGLRVARAAWLFGVRVSEYQRLKAGSAWLDWETYDRIERFFGWPRPRTPKVSERSDEWKTFGGGWSCMESRRWCSTSC